MTDASPPLRGRAREALHNDARIFEVALAMLTRDREASISAIGRAASVGKAALYRRYPTREHLIAAVAEEVTRRYVRMLDDAHHALDASEPAEAVLRSFLLALIEGGFLGFLASTNARYTPTDEDDRLSAAGYQRSVALAARFHAAGALHADVTSLDLIDWAQAIATVDSLDADRVMPRRERMLSALLHGIGPSDESLAGPPPRRSDYLPT